MISQYLSCPNVSAMTYHEMVIILELYPGNGFLNQMIDN